MSNSIKISYNNSTHEFPLIEGTENEKGIDIQNLRSKTGLITYDPGYKNTGSCKSNITFLNGEEGILRYRGHSIEELCSKASFIQVAYLLIYGDLPDENELLVFENDIKKESIVDEDLKSILKSFPKSAHPMGVLASLTSALIAFNPFPHISLLAVTSRFAPSKIRAGLFPPNSSVTGVRFLAAASNTFFPIAVPPVKKI